MATAETEFKVQAAIIESANKFENYRFPQKSVNLLDYSRGVSYAQSGNTCQNLVDHTAFKHNYAEELGNIGELEELLQEADYYINTLYTYRSYSKPLPMIPADLDDEEKKRLYRTVFDIITPHIEKIQGLMEFNERLIKCFIKNLRLMIYPLEKKEPLWVDHIRILIRVIDKFFILNLLKDMKGQTKNDFSRYKRAFSFIRAILPNSGELMAQITEVHNFLNDPSHPNNIILWQLKQDCGGVPHREELMAMIITQCMDDIKDHQYITSNEKHILYRAILASIYLADDSEANLNVFKSKHFKNMSKIRDLVKKLPIVPVFMDIHTTVPVALSICDHFTKEYQQGTAWMDKRHEKSYDLIRWRTTIQEHYISFTANFVTFLHNLRSSKKKGDDGQIDLKLYARGFELVVRGMKLLGDWTAKLKEQVVFKSANPTSEAIYKTLGGRGGPAKTYEQITRFNYSNELKYAMVEVIGLIKGLSNLLLSNETKIRAVLSQYVHIILQEFVHKSMVWPLHKAFKKKKDHLEELLLTARLIAADNYNAGVLGEDYKAKKEKEVKANIANLVMNQRGVL